MSGLAELAKLIPQAMAAAGNSPTGVRNVIGQQQQMEDRRREEDQRQRLKAFGREVFGGGVPGGATPETIFSAAQKHSIPPGHAMQLASEFMAFRQARQQAAQGPNVAVSTPIDGGGFIRRTMPTLQAEQYTAGTPGSFIGERYGMPKPMAQIQDPFRSSPMGIYDTRTGQITARAPMKTGGGGMPRPQMINVFKRGQDGGTISAKIPSDQYGQYSQGGWQRGQYKAPAAPRAETGGLSDNSIIQHIRETEMMNSGDPAQADVKVNQYLVEKARHNGDREKALMAITAAPQQQNFPVTATNKKTGEQMGYDGSQWVPMQ